MAEGLFGPSPWEIQQAQQQAMVQNAAAYAQQSPLERAAAGMYQAGGMLGGMAAGAFGGKNVAVEQAKRQEQIMGQGEDDLGTSAGMAAKAEQFRKVGDLRTATTLTMKANEMRKQETAATLAQQKQDEQESFRRDQLVQQAELKKAELEQRAARDREAAENMRLSIEQRDAASRRADATDRMIATLTAEMKRAGIEAKAATAAVGKPLTPAQQIKRDKEMATSASAIRAQDNDIISLGGDIDKVVSDPNLSRATGISDYVWSRPGGAASQIEGQLDSIVNKLKAQGLKVLREGGGIGAITEKEWDILANQVANIDRKKGAEYVKGELEKVKLRMNEMKRNAAQRHAEQFGEEYTPSREAAPAPGAKPRIKFDANGNVIK